MPENISEQARKDLKRIVGELFYDDLTNRTIDLDNKVLSIDSRNNITALNTALNDKTDDIQTTLIEISSKTDEINLQISGSVENLRGAIAKINIALSDSRNILDTISGVEQNLPAQIKDLNTALNRLTERVQNLPLVQDELRNLLFDNNKMLNNLRETQYALIADCKDFIIHRVDTNKTEILEAIKNLRLHSDNLAAQLKYLKNVTIYSGLTILISMVILIIKMF